MKKTTLTIGIPAYNEEANIATIIDDILSQNTNQFTIEKIIVASDKSTDRTDEIVKNSRNKKVQLISNTKREGQAKRQNQIMKKSTSDILVLINADTRIFDKNFLEKLVAPIMKGADLTSSYPLPLKPDGLMEKILAESINMKTEMFESYRNGQNVYTCHGRARALSKRLYKELRFNNSVGEDAYSYLFTVTNNFIYKNVPGAKIYYKLPHTKSDHANQSIRFIQTKKMLSDEFGKNVAEREFYIPKSLTIKAFAKSFIKNPFYTTLYIATYIYMTTMAKRTKQIGNTWTISQSSKSLTN